MLGSCTVTQNYTLIHNGDDYYEGYVDIKSYDCPNFNANPPPLPVFIKLRINLVPFEFIAGVTFTSPSGKIFYDVLALRPEDNFVGEIKQSSGVFSVTTPDGKDGQQSQIECNGPHISPFPRPNILVTNVVLLSNIPNFSGYVSGDHYNINLVVCNDSQIAASVTFIRYPQLSINTQMNNNRNSQLSTNTDFDNTGLCIGCSCIYGTSTCGSSACKDNVCQNVEVPKIQIIAQTKIDGSDMAEAVFIVCDEFSYDKQCDIPSNICRLRYIPADDLKQTRFDECCPYMVSVVRGRGATLREKLQYIYAREETRIGVTFDKFYERIMLYGMGKYILARLLYCKFNINFLLGKYNDKFLEKLEQSRFCAFVEFFKDCNSVVYGYQRYFKSGQRH